MVNKPLIRLYFWGVREGGLVDQSYIIYKYIYIYIV